MIAYTQATRTRLVLPRMALLTISLPPKPTANSKPKRKGVRRLVHLAFLALVCFTIYEVCQRLVGWNFHTVLPGRVFRGAQPSAGNIETLASVYGVRTIINLRGCGVPEGWYIEETERAQR